MTSLGKRNFIGIGKLRLSLLRKLRLFKFPTLHFLIEKKPSGRFEAINVDLLLVTIGDTVESAVAKLADLTLRNINTIMNKGRGYEELIEKADTPEMGEYWCAYRKIAFTLAGMQDHKMLGIANDIEDKVNAAVVNSISVEQIEGFENWFRKVAAKAADDIIKDMEMRRTNIMQVQLVTYDNHAA
jgi:hypothetical protein